MAPAVHANKESADSALVTMQEAAERLVSVPWAADFLCVSEPTVRRYLTQKILRRFKVGGRTLIKLGDLQKLVKEVK
jgi:Helix-turn-helix domain